MRPHRSFVLTLAAALLAALPIAAQSDKELAESDRVSELERKVDLLTDELARTRQDMGVPEDKPLESVHGMGPGASKIYGITKGLSIGGYAEGGYTAVVHDKHESGENNSADFTRAVLYTGYKFTDRILFNTEIEFEHGSTEENGSVSVEFATLDFLIRDEVNTRAGLVLLPVGFLNEIHEPPFYYGTHRPDVEEVILPTTWREVGAGLFGRIADQIEYKLYAVASLDASAFEASGIREGRQQGSETLAEDLAVAARVDWEPIPELMIGASAFVGETGQDQTIDGVSFPDAQLTLWDVHTELNTHGLRVRGLFAMNHLRDAGSLTLARLASDDEFEGAIAENTLGGYGEIGYEILQWIAPQSGWTAEPFVRAEYIDTQYDMPSGFDADKSLQYQVYTVGVSVKPIPNVVLKFDYRNKDARVGELGDEINLGLGVVF